MMQMLLKLARRGEKPIFVNNKREFLSVWSIAHAWENISPETTDMADIPASIQDHIDTLLLAFLRDELPLRRPNGYRVLSLTLFTSIFGLDKDFDRIADQLYRKCLLDRAFIDDLYVKRADLLRWCQGEFRVPPLCWAISSQTEEEDERVTDDDDENDHWYEKLTPQRKERTACLEVARHLWDQNKTLTYEQVRTHPVMKQAGLTYVFNEKQFKKWAGRVSPDEAKKGGRRSQSMN